MENEKVEKPLILKRKEFIDSMVGLINNSELPAFIIEPVLRDLLSETQVVMKQEYEKSLEYYNKHSKPQK